MKPIQMTGTTTGRLLQPVDESPATRSVAMQETFHASWRREVNDAATGDGKLTSRSTVAPRNDAAMEVWRNSSPDATPVSDRTQVGKTSHANVPPDLQKGGPIDSKLTYRAQVSAAPGMKTRHEYATSVSAIGAVPKGRHKSVSSLEISPGEHSASGIGAAATQLAAKIVDGHSIVRLVKRHEPASIAIDKTGSTKQLHNLGTVKTVQSGSLDRGLSNENAVTATDKATVDQQPIDGKDKTRSATLPEAKPPKEISTRENVPGSSSAATEVQLGSTNIVSATAAVRPALSGDVRVEVPRRLASAGSSSGNVALQTLISTPARLDVGVFSGTHGWLRVRAELGTAGLVNASVTAIDAAHETLRSAVPEIEKYLSVEEVKVSSIEIHRFDDVSGALSGATEEGRQGGGGQQGTDEDLSYCKSEDLRGREQNEASDSILDSGGMAKFSGNGDWIGNAGRMPSGVVWQSGLAGVGTWLNVCA
jgi:hypothetical protein